MQQSLQCLIRYAVLYTISYAASPVRPVRFPHSRDSGGEAGNRELDFSHKEVSDMKLTKNLGMLLLSIWLILNGLIALLSFSFQGLHLIMGLLAIIAGVLILFGR